jgi:type IV secretory pathway VirJ component
VEAKIMGFSTSTDFEFDVDDWVAWDKIIQDHQSLG